MPDFAIENLTRNLISAMPKLLLMVATARGAEEAQATRVKTRKELNRLNPEGILRLLEGNDMQSLAHIDAAGPACMSLEQIAHVQDFAERALRARKSVKASEKKDDNQRDAGSGRAWADRHAPSAKDLCAMIVREISMRYGGGAPPPSNRQAREAAALIWAAAGGDPSRWEYDGAKATGWIKHFKRATALTDRPEHKTITQLLKAADPPRRLPPVVWEASADKGGLRMEAASAGEAAADKIRRFRSDEKTSDQTLDARVARRYQSRKSQSA